jgi:hypothetical protein
MSLASPLYLLGPCVDAGGDWWTIALPRPMKARLLCSLAAAAVIAGLAGCGTLGRHYDEELSQAPAAPREGYAVPVRISIDTKPTGAMISINGAQVSSSPTSMGVELNPDGTFAEAVEVTADFSVVNPVRGVSHTVSVNFRRGEPAPKLLILARAADGGIQRLDRAMGQK